MADLSLLNRNFPVQDTPGLETIDPRFGEIAGLAQNGQFADLKAQVEDLLQEDILDIRLLGYYFFAIFEEEDVPCLAEVFSGLSFLLTENWEAIGPENKKDKQAEKSLQWFLAKLLKVLEYKKEKTDEHWQTWVNQSSTEQNQQVMETANHLSSIIAGIIAESKCVDLIRKINYIFQEVYNLAFEREKRLLAEQQPDPEPEQEEEEQQEYSVSRSKNARVSEAMEEASVYIRLLIEKLQAFETLIARDEFAKAALVADDLNQTIENFDPRQFLPKLFSNYYALLSTHIEHLAEYWENKDTLVWQSMEQLYKVDLERFVDL